MAVTIFPTSLVGSYPQPKWLIDRARLSKMVPRVRMDDLWLVDPMQLEAKQDKATRMAIQDQESAGLDIITDGEQRRESYSNRLATALDGDPHRLETRQKPEQVMQRRVCFCNDSDRHG